MPGVLPKGLKAEEAVGVFERAGGIRRSGRGSHTNVKMPNGQLITIPGHGELKVGLLRAAIKKAGLSVEESLELVGRS
jgi:predicted RNA binding protein YcfA (HicA-like mRNA interferase family)